MNPAGRVADVFRSHKLLIGLSAACGLLFSATTLIPPLYVRGLIAAITGAPGGADSGAGADGVSLAVVIAALVGAFLLRGAARYLYGLTSHQAAYALLSDLLQHVYRHLQRLSHRFFAANRTGTLIARSVSDVESLEDFVAHGVPELVQAVAIPAGHDRGAGEHRPSAHPGGAQPAAGGGAGDLSGDPQHPRQRGAACASATRRWWLW